MFIMILWKNDAYSSKSEFVRWNQEHRVGHPSDVACGGRPGDVAQRQAATTKACMHQTWHVRIWQITTATGIEHKLKPALISRGVCASVGRQRRWPAPIDQWQATSAKACSHKPWCVRIWQTTSANGLQHKPRPARISRGVCASAGCHRPWPARIGPCLHASTVACAHLANDFSQQHAACLHVSAVACAHRLGDIGRDLRASSYGR